mmetsp:Transcript_9983/g.25698  ORF Transcript_9983/g.25698 Transcript_9983/m.25698 type:complete len:149 (-) Transcript_9983:418-864(-)
MLMDEYLRRKWEDKAVMSLVFDGLMAEAPGGTDMDAVLRDLEAWLQEHDWQIKLAEKPLYGLQNAQLPTLVAARRAHADFQLQYGVVDDGGEEGSEEDADDPALWSQDDDEDGGDEQGGEEDDDYDDGQMRPLKRARRGVVDDDDDDE